MELIDFCKEYWSVIVAIVGIIVTFVTLKNQNQDQERRISELEKGAKELSPVLLEIRTKLAGIEATLQMLVNDK